MKKIFALVLALTTIAGSAFSNTTDYISKNVLNAFAKEFKNAEKVEWQATDNYIRAKFFVDNQPMFAYYTEEGELMGVARNVSLQQLPLKLSTDLKEKLTEFWLAELFEVSSNGETNYYVTIKNDKKVLMLQGNGAGWQTYKKKKA